MHFLPGGNHFRGGEAWPRGAVSGPGGGGRGAARGAPGRVGVCWNGLCWEGRSGGFSIAPALPGKREGEPRVQGSLAGAVTARSSCSRGWPALLAARSGTEPFSREGRRSSGCPVL